MNNTGDNLVFLSFLFHPYGYPHVWIVCGWCVTPSKDDHDNTVDESLSVGYIKETNPHNPHSPTSHGRPLHNLPSGSEVESRGELPRIHSVHNTDDYYYFSLYPESFERLGDDGRGYLPYCLTRR